MAALAVLIGLYLAMVGYHHNATALGAQFWSDSKSMLPWALAIVVLGAWASYGPPASRAMGKAFFVLVLVVFTLKNGTGLFDRIKQLTN